MNSSQTGIETGSTGTNGADAGTTLGKSDWGKFSLKPSGKTSEYCDGSM
jgi:hypothetical protein